MTPDELRRALAFNAVAPALSSRDQWLPFSVRRAVANAVLDAIQPIDQPRERQLAHQTRAHASTIVQARRWADRALTAETALARVRAFADRLDGFADATVSPGDRALYQALATDLRNALEPQETRP